MTTDEPPEFEPEEPTAGAGPGVGNVLGFSLLFRERRALLALSRRSLAAGVRLREYEALIPGVRLPLRGPLTATTFRNRRCRVIRAVLAVEDRALRPWLEARLVGQRLAGVTVTEVDLELRRELPGAALPRPCLTIGLRTAGGRTCWLLAAFDLDPVGRSLVLRPCRLWLIGELDGTDRDPSAEHLWRALARRVAGATVAGVRAGVTASDDGQLSVDVGRVAMTQPFVSVGWKAPNLQGCAIAALDLTRRSVMVTLRGPLTDTEPGEEEAREGEGWREAEELEASDEARAVARGLPGEPGLRDEPIAAGLDQVRALLRADARDPSEAEPSTRAALDQLAELGHALAGIPAARLAVVRWRVQIARFFDRAGCLAAVYEWLDLQPSAREPRRLIALLLAGADRAQELARLLAVECREPHEPVALARLELAVASLLVDRLDDGRSALTILGPLIQRIRAGVHASRERRASRREGLATPPLATEHAALAALLPEALVVLARARVAEVAREGRSLTTAPHVMEALDEALEATPSPRRRADLRAAVADAFARHGAEQGSDRAGERRALALLTAAIADDPDDDALLDRAIELGVRVEERATAVELLQRRLARAAPRERTSLRKRLIAVACELDDRRHRELARRELTLALEHEPDNPALLRRAANLERKLGNARAAAELLGRLLELDAVGELTLDDRDRLVLDRARLLQRSGQIDRAWESLRGVVSSIPDQPEPHRSGSRDADARGWALDVIELSLELAPPTERPRMLDLLIAYASGQRRGEALVERAAQALRVDERLADLWAALAELDAPARLLPQIEQLVEDRDEDGLARLAVISAELGDHATELLARARLGRLLLDDDAVEQAIVELERALALAPSRSDLRHALAEGYQRAERHDDAIAALTALLDAEPGADRPNRARLSLALARELLAIGDAEAAVERLTRALADRGGDELPDELPDELDEALVAEGFAACRQLGDARRALAFALDWCARCWPGVVGATRSAELGERVGVWLARAARLLDEAGVESLAALDPALAARVGVCEGFPSQVSVLFERAVELRPGDLELADEVEARLRELDEPDAVADHLRRQLARDVVPQRRADLLERLIALLEAGAHEGVHGELDELLDELLTLRPGHGPALLSLGRLRYAAGELAQARQLWTLAAAELDPLDPRFVQPALVLARDAIGRDALDDARRWAERARASAPDEPEPLRLLASIAQAQGDPELAIRVLRERLELGAGLDPQARAAVEVDLGLALATGEPNARPERARAAMLRLAALERLPPRAGDELAAERWLALALELEDLEHQARARAALRERLGERLDLDALIAEIELLDRQLDRPERAIELCGEALLRRGPDPALLASLAALLERRGGGADGDGLLERAALALRTALEAVGVGEARTRVAGLLAVVAHRREDPATVALALAQLPADQIETGELAELHDWAIRRLGRVDEELARIDAALTQPGLDPGQRAARVERLLRLLDGDRAGASARLLTLAERTERGAGLQLADAAIALVEPLLDDPEDRLPLTLALAALRRLAQHADRAALRRQSARIEPVLVQRSDLDAIAAFVEILAASEDPHLLARADALLREHLPRAPAHQGLLRALWARANPADPVGAGACTRATAWLEALVTERALPAPLAARLLDALASVVEAELGADVAAKLLADRAEALADDHERFAGVCASLRARRRWPELVRVLAQSRDPGARDPAAWLAIADAAAADHDRASEVQARERAAALLASAAGLALDAPAATVTRVDPGLAAATVEQLQAVIERDPARAGSRWRLALALEQLGQSEAAERQLGVLLEREQWAAAGIELGELNLRAGLLAAARGDHDRAVTLLTEAHARAGAERRESASEALFGALLAVDRRPDAVTLAKARAAEHDRIEAAIAWLERAAAISDGAGKVELLTRARELAFDHGCGDAEALDAALEGELRALGDRAAVEGLLRDRITRQTPAPDADPAARDRWIAAVEALVHELGADAITDERGHDDDAAAQRDSGRARAARAAERVRLCEQLLALVPDHREALLTVADDRRRRGLDAQALELWARAEPLLDDGEPRLYDLARALADHRASAGDLAEAYRLIERALTQRPSDHAALERRHELACALDDTGLVLRAAEALLEQRASLARHRVAELYGDVAQAEALLGHARPALAAIEQATRHADAGTELHRTLVERWLALLNELELDDETADPEAPARRELAARTELRRALGPALTRAQRLRELDLHLGLGDDERASELLEALLVVEPEAADLRARLAQLDRPADEPAPERGGERSLRTLRRVVDALAPGPVRDRVATTLALDSRRLDAPRTALDALDHLSGPAAASPELLDLRIWAVRKLDRVEDELRELDGLLTAIGRDQRDQAIAEPFLVDRLLRVLEHDVEACARRLFDLATGTGEPGPDLHAQLWLLESALRLIRDHAGDRPATGVQVLAALIDRLAAVAADPDPTHPERNNEARRTWQLLAAASLQQASRDRRALELVTTLVRLADTAARAGLPGYAELGETLLDRAIIDFPDQPQLHRLARERGPADDDAALDRIERLADDHRIDARARASLYLGFAATLSDAPELPDGDALRSPRRRLLRALASAHAGEPAIFGPLREALRQLGAFRELIELFDVVGADAELWIELADDAAAAAEATSEAVARRRAGEALLDRVGHDERRGSGSATDELDRACSQLGRAAALEPDDVRTQVQHARALERAGRLSEAFALLTGLLDSGRYADAGLELGQLARRCGLLAVEIAAPERAAELLRVAYTELGRPLARISVAERLFEVLVGLADRDADEEPQASERWRDRAGQLAAELATLIEDERRRAGELGGDLASLELDPLPWLVRAAQSTRDDGERVGLYARAHQLAPEDEDLADRYEDSLAALGQITERVGLLRRRVRHSLAAGERARAVAQIGRLLALLEPLSVLREAARADEAEVRERARARVRDRAELLEQWLHVDPLQDDARLELAELRLVEGDREAAASHWRQLGERLASGDPRFAGPARALAAVARESGDLDQARAWLERARASAPEDRGLLVELLELARALGDPAAILPLSAALLTDAPAQASPETPSAGPSRSALLRERAGAFEQLERISEALASVREAAAASEPGSDEHIEASRQWLRLATRQAGGDRRAAELEAEARAELRRALGDRLPARARLAEAKLLAERLDQRDAAIALVHDGLSLQPGDPELLAGYEELCAAAGEQRRFVEALADLLLGTEPGDEARLRIAEKLARAARALDVPRFCLTALDALPTELSERPELLELRDWAVRSLGHVDEELARLDAALLALGPNAAAERVPALVARMLRLRADAGEPVAARLLELASAPGLDPELPRALARAALRTAREYAPDQLSIAVAAVRACVEREPIRSIAPLWPGIEALALASAELEPLLELLRVAILAARTGEAGFEASAERLIAAALGRDPSHAEVHALLRVRLGWDVRGPEIADLDAAIERLFTSLDALVEVLGLDAARSARLWSAALTGVEAEHGRAHPSLPARLDARIVARAEATLASAAGGEPLREALAPWLALLEGRGRWAEVLALELRAAPITDGEGLTSSRLATIAGAAAAAGDSPTRLRARVELGGLYLARHEPNAAAEAFADALAVAPDRLDLQYRLGVALAVAGRSDAALERLLPLLARRDLPQRLPELNAELGERPPIDTVGLARRCADLLVAVDDHERAATVYQRALEASDPGDVRRVAIVEALYGARVRLGDGSAAAELAVQAAAELRARPEQRLVWLLRVAEHADDPRQAADALAEAHAIEPSDALADRLERAFERLGDTGRLAALLRERVAAAEARSSDPASRASGAAAQRRLIALMLADPERSADTRAVAAAWDQLLRLEPEDVDATLALAELRERSGELDAAVAAWGRAGALLAADDDRFFQPALRLASYARARGRLGEARTLLERALLIRPADLGTLDALRSLAIAADDPELQVRALTGLLDQPERAPERAQLELEAARAHTTLAIRRSRNLAPDPDALAAALAGFERAAAAARVTQPGSPLHREIARAWLEQVARDALGDAAPPGSSPLTDGEPSLAQEREAAARAELRAAFGDELAPADLRAEASLLALGLGRVDDGLGLVEGALLTAPDDPLLLSCFKDLCMATGNHRRYADVLDQAIAALGDTPSRTRDRLATELAFTAVELDDAPRLLAQLDRLSPDRASAPELLDLREWAIRQLGRVDDELTEIDDELLACRSREDAAVLVERLLRMLDHSPEQTGQRLLTLAERTGSREVAERLHEAALELARSAGPSYFDVLLVVIEWLLAEVGPGRPPTVDLVPHWPAIEKLALERDDPGLLALLVELGQRAVAAGLEPLGQRVDDLRDLALLRHPDSAELHAVVLGAVARDLGEVDRDSRLHRADAAVVALADRLGASGRKRARLWVGFAKLLDRRDGAALLSRRARVEIDDDPVFATLVAALEDDNHWTRALELLEHRVARSADGDVARQVDDLKHLAHLCADILGDPEAAIAHLERALDYAPEDPDLMLPLLDHYYAQPRLDRAIELSARVLEHVPMGPAAFAALGHRAADAALATGEHELAEQLLRKILGRAPDDARTRDRLRELEQLARDPEHRVRMLAAIANRSVGSARVEALEERARLLLDPLGRVEEAIADLEAALAEAPARPQTTALLADLYQQRQRWPALVALLERDYPRQHGIDRVLTLERVASIQREGLGQPAKAERALRLALDNLDSVAVDELATALDERPAVRATLLDERIPGVVLPARLTEARGRDSVRDDDLEPDPAEAPEPAAPPEPPEPVSLERARQAWARLADRLHLELVECLASQGRHSELIAHLEDELGGELRGEVDPRLRFPDLRGHDNPRLVLIQRLARALRDHVDDGERTARVYVRLEQLDALPDEGLATLARWYRSQQRYDDLVRILTVRSRKLAALGDWDRKAEADYRIGELLEGPLRRPHEAARFFLDAYLANPFDNPGAGNRARVLLAGTDSIANVRNRLLRRLDDLRDDYKPALLTLLADLLAPHDEHEDEAERRYREALGSAPELASALEGLGRLLSRQGRLEAAVEPLTKAAASPDVSDERAADDAAAAARALIELDRGDEAEAVLMRALARAPESQRPLLELARIYDRLGRKSAEGEILARLAALPLSSMLRAEVGYRQAMLLADEFRAEPMSEAGERARALLLEAVGADAMHAQARQVLLDLASARSEWSIVAHMHFLAIRELPPGPRRALTHLDLAATYLDRLSDAGSAVRNLGAALQQAPADVVVVNRATALAARLPDPGEAAARVEQFARSPGRPELGETMTDAARARLLLIASELHLRNDTLEPAELAARAALALPELPADLRAAAERAIEQLVQIDQGELDLRKRRKSLLNKLDATEDPVERLQIFARLRETASRLGDREDLEALTRQQLELAHALLERPEPPGEPQAAANKAAALGALRDVFAATGDYAKVVALYEDLAGRTGDAHEAAELLTSAARFAWSGLRDPRLAVAIVRRALDRAPTHGPATELLGEIAGASDEREVDETICDELSQLAPRQRPPLLTLRLAEAALRLDRREQAQAVLRQLLAGEAAVELRLQALSLLDGLLDGAGRTHDRVPLLEERLELCRRHWPDRAADVALDLARAQRAVGNLQDARATCRTALLDKPSDRPLTKLYAELLEQAEDWPALARALEQLANLTIETGEQARWLTRAAQVQLDHASDGRESIAAARRLLERARAVSIESTEARAVLLPLAFHQGDWERVLELAVELRAIAGDEHEALIYAALTEAFARGKRTLARSIGDRHDRATRQRVLWRACARMLEQIAHEGPLPRLDALLAAAAALCGGTEELLDELHGWAVGQPLRAGLALGLARLNEAFRRMELARNLYQVAAFLAPSGPVPALTTRLPTAELPASPLQEDGWIPLEWRGALREVLIQLRKPLAGVRGKSSGARPPRTAKERQAVQLATVALGPWRAPLGLDLDLAVTEQPLVAGVGVRNLAKPTIVVNEGFVDLPEVERRYRLAYAAAALATGLAAVLDDDPIGVPDLLDALTALARPRHEPSTDTARQLVDTLAARGLTAARVDADLRRALARELDHWRGAPDKLERVMHRACMLIATRLSGHVDGALTAAARDRGMLADPGKPIDPALLDTSNAAWLLRALGVLGG